MTATSDASERYQERISPMKSSGDRPRWSVMIPRFNCANYLRATLESMLCQDPGSDVMQLEVVDDYSTLDDPSAVVHQIGHGRVEFVRQPSIVGHVANFNTSLRRSRGELVHILHGDDCVAPGFYPAMQHVFEQHPDVGAAFCQHIVIDEDGHWIALAEMDLRQSGPIPDWFERIATGQRLQPPAMVVRRSVYEELGGFDRRIAAYDEDWEMWVPISTRHVVLYEPKPLVMYRVRTQSLSAHTLRTGANMRDLAKVMTSFRGMCHTTPDRMWFERPVRPEH